MKLIVKYFLLADILVLGGCLKIWIKIFSIGLQVLFGVLSWIKVLLHLGKYGNNMFLVCASVHKNFSRKFTEVRF